MSGRRIDSVTGFLFGNGLGFFGLYVLTYLGGWALGMSPSSLRIAFVAVHAVLAPLLLVHCYRRRRLVDLTTILFWVGLTVVFLLPGAYLEYPDDSWEHIRRIFSWEHATSVGESEVRLRFASFWMWTLVSEVPIPERRTAMSLLSCFWQLLLAFQVYRFSLALGYDRVWARVQVVGTLCLFGTNLFSFSRYHALASTALAYCAYLATAALLVRFLGLGAAGETTEIRKPSLGTVSWMAVLVVIMFLDHRQELLLFAVAAGTLALVRGWYSPKWKRPIAVGLGSTAIGVVLFAGWNMDHQELVELKQWFPWARQATSWFDPSIWHRVAKAWCRGLGLHHVLAVVTALALARRSSAIAWLTITPVLMMFFPPLILAATALHGSSGEWFNERMPLVLSGSFILVEAIRLWLGPLSRRGALVVAVVVLVALGLPPWKCIRGRLWFQLHRSPTTLELQPLDQTLEWLRLHRLGQLTPENRSLVWAADWITTEKYTARYEPLLPPDRCVLVADGTTAFAASAQLGLGGGTVRRRSEWPQRVPSSPRALERWSAERGVCAFLVAHPDWQSVIPASKVARLAGRDDALVVREDLMTPESYRLAVGRLVAVGWTATTVPPFHTLYEPPNRPLGSAPARRIWASRLSETGELFSDGFESGGILFTNP